jgi:TM2 domain-containing membrane protein YozV
MTYPQQPGYDPYGQQQPGYGQQPGYPSQPGYGPQPGFAADPNLDKYGRPLSDKSKIVAALLQFFLGSLGIGRFYTGHVGIAIAQLLTCGGCGIWALIDAIMFLASEQTDAQGRVLRS